MAELKPCPLCNTADNIHLYRHYPNTIKRYEYGCDCGFFTPSAITKRGAARRWNSYVKVWKNGFDEGYQTIMTELDEALEIMRVNVPETKTIDIAEAIEALPKKGCKQCKWRNEPSISLRCRDCRGGEDYPNFEFEYLKPKKGEWIDFNPSDPLDPRMKCSYCGGVELPKTTWAACPLCGADMKGESND